MTEASARASLPSPMTGRSLAVPPDPLTAPTPISGRFTAWDALRLIPAPPTA